MNTLEFLQPFCAKANESREYMRAPFCLNGWIFATDGHIAVRIPEDVQFPICTDEKVISLFPRFNNYFEQFDKFSFFDLPVLPKADPCMHCGGGGKVNYSKIACDECDGDGEFYYGSHYYSCKHCAGSGEIKHRHQEPISMCEKCRGSGFASCQPVKINDCLFNLAYLKLIEKLPNLQIATNGIKEVLRIKFDGGSAVLMPMNF